MVVLKLLCVGFVVIIINMMIWVIVFGGGSDIGGGLSNGIDCCSPSGVTVFFATAAVTIGGFSFWHGSLSGFDVSFNTGQNTIIASVQ